MSVRSVRIVEAVAAAVMVIASVVPWYSAGPVGISGTDDIGVVAFVVAAAAAIATTIERWWEPARGVLLGAGVLGVAMSAVAAVDPPAGASLSVGLPAYSVGAVVCAVSAAIRVFRAAPVEPPAVTEANKIARSPLLRTLAWTGSAAGLALTAIVIWPATTDLGASADPARTYDEAVARFTEVAQAELDDTYEPCRSRLYDHGERTDVVVVLFHGLTNCPRQFVEMAEALHDAGANVLIPRAPGHGVASGSTDELAGAGALGRLSAERLAQYADDAVDIATGLGDDVRVGGLSMGGVIALWAGQHRSDVDRVVSIAPAFQLPGMPNLVTEVFTNVFSRAPTFTLSHERAIDHDYAAESTRGLAATFQLGEAVGRSALNGPPMADDVRIVLNPDDPLVSESSIEAFVDMWNDRGAEVTTTLLEARGLRHDCIDVGQPNADPDAVYPTVIEELGFDRSIWLADGSE